MTEKCMQYTCCLILFIVWIDQGDGSWKKKDIQELQHDIEIFKRIAAKVEKEMKVFYDEFTDSIAKHDIQYPKYKESLFNMKLRNTGGRNNKTTISRKENIAGDKLTLFEYINKKEKYINVGKNINGSLTNIHSSKDSIWPTFEEILLSIGKKYDWKTDRWIKVKNRKGALKIKGFNIQHKFIYRTVKLNKSKSKKNIVTVVTAVR